VVENAKDVPSHSHSNKINNPWAWVGIVGEMMDGGCRRATAVDEKRGGPCFVLAGIVYGRSFGLKTKLRRNDNVAMMLKMPSNITNYGNEARE